MSSVGGRVRFRFRFGFGFRFCSFFCPAELNATLLQLLVRLPHAAHIVELCLQRAQHQRLLHFVVVLAQASVCAGGIVVDLGDQVQIVAALRECKIAVSYASITPRALQLSAGT